MNCDNLSKFVTWVLAIAVIVDVLLLYADLENRKCNEIKDKELEDTLTKLNNEIKLLQQEIELLKNQ